MSEVPYIAAIVLAAGLSSRMGDKNKLLATVHGTPLIRNAVHTVQASQVSDLIVVTGHEEEKVKQALSGTNCTFVTNEHFAKGMSTSLKAGVAALPDGIDGFMIVLGDMPDLTPEIINQLIDTFDGRICVPTANGKPGNPVLFPASMKTEFETLAGDSGAKPIVQKHKSQVLHVDVGTTAIHLDLDDEDAFKQYTS